MMALADTITEKARHLRRIMILDCCFAAAAFRAFQADPAQIALAKTVNAFEVKKKGTGFPGKGVALLCSSDQKTPSLLLPDGSCTMFSKALLDALSKGSAGKKDQLSLRDVKDIAADILHDMPTRNAPRPVVHSPDQSEGDVADVPFFPNPVVKTVETSQGREVLLTQEEDDKDQEGAEEHGSQPREPPQVLTSFQQRQGLSIGTIIGVVVLVLILISGTVFALVTYLAPARPAHLRPTTAQASATTKAAATATGIANQNPYSPFEGTLKLNDPLIDNNKGYQWDIGPFAGGSCGFIGGDYHVVASQYGRFFGCIARTPTFTDFAFQVQMIVTKGNSGGILFRRAGNPSAFYIFTIGTDGSYKLMFFDGRNPTSLRQSTSPYINTGLKQPNLIAVVMKGSTINLYTNGKLLDSTSHSTLRSGGIGLVAADITEVAFRDAKVWTL